MTLDDDLTYEDVKLAIQAAWQAKAYELAEELARDNGLPAICLRCASQNRFIFDNKIDKTWWIAQVCYSCRCIESYQRRLVVARRVDDHLRNKR